MKVFIAVLCLALTALADHHEGHDHAGHEHDGHDHAGHEHDGHDHTGHDHTGHDHTGHDHTGHDHTGHDHTGHDQHILHDGHDYTIKTQEDLTKFREECGSKLNIPADLMEKYKSWNYPNDETTRCYMKCIFERFGFFDETEGFNAYLIHHQLVGAHGPVDHNDELHRKIDICADKNGQKSDACTWAYRGAMCFLSLNLKLVQDSVAH